MFRLSSVVLAALIALAAPVSAQQDAPKPVQAEAAKKDEKEKGKAEAQKPAMPHPNKMRILIRGSMIALNHATQTGNFTVLRDLGAPGFRNANSAARLAELFATLRKRNIDLAPVMVIEPKLSKQPSINDRGHLRLTGFFPSRPEQVNFDLAYEMVDGDWRLFGIAVSTAPVPNQPVAQAKPPQEKAKTEGDWAPVN